MNTIRKPLADGFIEGLLALGAQDPRVVVLEADLSCSTRTCLFADRFPQRFFNLGIAEQNMVGMAAGMALRGLVPFVSNYSVFNAGRAWEQIRTSVCYNNLAVKFGGAHAGLSAAPEGGTHQSLEEIAILRVLPNMTVLVPCDAEETRQATIAAATIPGPVYIRHGKEALPLLTSPSTTFQPGRSVLMRPGRDITVIACGMMVAESLEAAATLAGEGIGVRVLNCHTIKPLDREAIISAARETGALVSAEEHQQAGGLGGAIAELVVQDFPVPMGLVGMADRFGESGSREELMKEFGLNAQEIIREIRRVLKMKPAGEE